MRDAGPELPLRRELRQRLHVRDRERGVDFVQDADAHADGVDALDEEIVAADIGRAAAEETEDQVPPAPGEAAQRFVSPPCRRSGRRRCPRRGRRSALSPCPRSRRGSRSRDPRLPPDTPRASPRCSRWRSLSRRRASPPGLPRCRCRPPRRAPAPIRPRPCGRAAAARGTRWCSAPRNTPASSMLIASGTLSQNAAFALPISAKAPSRVPAHDPVAHAKAGDAGPDGGDHAGGFTARDERRLGPELVFPGEHQHVDCTARRAHRCAPGSRPRRAAADRARPVTPALRARRTLRTPSLS